MYLQGSDLLGIYASFDRSDLFVDSTFKYEIVAAEYLGDDGEAVVERPWLGYMREWGPKILYRSRMEIERLHDRLPWRLRCWIDAILRMIPVELSSSSHLLWNLPRQLWDSTPSLCLRWPYGPQLPASPQGSF